MTERAIVEEETMAAGVKRQRVLSLVDKLHRDGAISFEQFAAAGILRNAIMMEIAPSEGVSSYETNVSPAEPSAKADRAGRRLTEFEISPSGEISQPGGRGKSRRNERTLEDAILAAVGVQRASAESTSSMRISILIRVVTHTESMPTLTGITLEHSRHASQSPRRGYCRRSPGRARSTAG
jgi:hypothetical protein